MMVFMDHPARSTPSRGARMQRAAGFSMVEVLVSIVVLSFGMLGMVGLQASALKFGRDSRQQSTAVGLARELAEMMRANAHEAGKTTANPYLGSFSGSGLAPGVPSNCLDAGNTCSTTGDVANAQMTDWLRRVEAALPGARVLMADANGVPVDGDQLIYLLARDWQASGRLRGPVVGTLMTNYGLERALAKLEIPFVRTKVGDRYVVERMRATGCNVGGEQSGHIVLSDFATTGDGLLAALQVLAVMRQRERPASEIGRVFTPLPQRLRNIRLERRLDLAAPEIARLIDREQARLSGTGRLLVRASGTEPVMRVMVEAEDETLLAEVLETVSREIAARARAA